MTDCMVTMGPSCNNSEFIKFAFDEMNMRKFRLNMAYPLESMRAFEMLRNAYGNKVLIYQDFPGERFRLKLPSEESVQNIVVGNEYQLSVLPNTELPHISYLAQHFDLLEIGYDIAISDGQILGRIVSIDQKDKTFTIRIERASRELRNNAAFCIRSLDLSINSFTIEDKTTVKTNLYKGLRPDWIVLSFVSNPTDIAASIEWIQSKNIKVMAKIETPTGVENINRISKVCDGILIGRGDLLGTAGEMAFGSIYSKACKEIKSCRHHCETGIGTFFLRNYSLTKTSTAPELLDFHNAVHAGVDFVMLSKETVNSNYPRATVEMANSLLSFSKKNKESLVFPPIRNLKSVPNTPWIISIEGPNGVGKTTLAKRIAKEKGVPYKLAVPPVFMRDNILKKRMLFDADPMASALFYFSGLIEFRRDVIEEELKIMIVDRSLWSTAASLYAIGHNLCNKILKLIYEMRDLILFPDQIIVLNASQASCLARISQKEDGGLFDQDSEETFKRKVDFYGHLQDEYDNISFIDTDGLNESEVFNAFLHSVNISMP